MRIFKYVLATVPLWQLISAQNEQAVLNVALDGQSKLVNVGIIGKDMAERE